MSSSPQNRCDQGDLVAAYVVRALPRDRVHSAEAHIASCADCRRELTELSAVMDAFGAWRLSAPPPAPKLWEKLLDRISVDGNRASTSSPAQDWREPDWEEAAPGIFFKLLSTDVERDRVSMLVRLAPGSAYPPHDHAGVEELHLLQGELWIDDRKLSAGDYNRAERGSADQRVWSETGCICLLITSPSDVLR